MLNKSSGQTILAIDPGDSESAYVIYEDGAIHAKGKINNTDIELIIKNLFFDSFVIEVIKARGQPAGDNQFQTLVWTGMFKQMVKHKNITIPIHDIYREEIKLYLTGSTKTGDPHVRQALIELFPKEGGGKKPQIGNKKNPGPLYGFVKDTWAALGVAITYDEYYGELLVKRAAKLEEKSMEKAEKLEKAKATREAAKEEKNNASEP